MGINGLLQQLKSISRPTHVSSYCGQKVAIDGYSWLHKGAYCCSRELCEGIWVDGFIRYFISRIEMLLGNGVIPIVVFDGCRLPMKADEEESRRRNRREALERARAHAEAGNLSAATECYQRAVDIAPWMAKVVMEVLRERGVKCLVAPYEADAQMSYLALRNEVYAVLTEDSDMLAYGCPRVLYKLDRSGLGAEVQLNDLPLVRELNMAGFDHDMLLQMCILAGCDFLPNMAGVGIKKAHAMIRKHRDFVKVIRHLRFNGTSPPPGYEVRFQRTIWLFRHQRVFCPNAGALTHLRPLPPGGLAAADVLVMAALPSDGPEREMLTFLGPPLDAEVAAGIAEGGLDPSTLKPFDLPAIYRGCAHPPRHLRPLLLPAAAGDVLAPGSRGAGMSGPGGSQRRLSFPGSPSEPSQSQLRGPQHHQGYTHHHSQRKQHQSQPAGGHGRTAAGKPPVGPNGQINRYFFTPNPAASQPFRSHTLQTYRATNGQRGPGMQSLAGSQPGPGCGRPATQVVTLRGLPVETLDATAAGGGGREDCQEDGRSQRPMAAGRRVEDAGKEDDCIPPNSKRQRLSGCAEVSGGIGGVSGSLFAHFRRRALAAPPTVAAGHCSVVESVQAKAKLPSQSQLLPSQSLSQDHLSWDELKGDLHDPAAAGTASAVVALREPQPLRTGSVPDGGTCGSGEEILPGSMSSILDSQRTILSSQGQGRSVWSGPESDPHGLEGHMDGLMSSGTGARDASNVFDSQNDSQRPASGSEESAWASWRAGSGGSAAAGGLLAGRSRAPARLAMEALFMEASGGSQTALGAGGGGGGVGVFTTGPGGEPTSSAGNGSSRQVRGALEALQSWRQGTGPAAVGSVIAFGIQQQASIIVGGGMQLLQEDLGLECDRLGLDDEGDAKPLDAAAGCTRYHSVPAASAPLAPGVPPRMRKPPPQFSIYELDDKDSRAARDQHLNWNLDTKPSAQCPAGGSLFGSPHLFEKEASPPQPTGAGPLGHVCRGATARLRGRDGSDDDDDEDDHGEAEITSPLKLPTSMHGARPRVEHLQLHSRTTSSPPAPGSGRSVKLAAGMQMRPSARRRLTGVGLQNGPSSPSAQSYLNTSAPAPLHARDFASELRAAGLVKELKLGSLLETVVDSGQEDGGANWRPLAELRAQLQTQNPSCPDNRKGSFHEAHVQHVDVKHGIRNTDSAVHRQRDVAAVSRSRGAGGAEDDDDGGGGCIGTENGRNDGGYEPDVAEFTRALERSEARWQARRRSCLRNLDFSAGDVIPSCRVSVNAGAQVDYNVYDDGQAAEKVGTATAAVVFDGRNQMTIRTAAGTDSEGACLAHETVSSQGVLPFSMQDDKAILETDAATGVMATAAAAATAQTRSHGSESSAGPHGIYDRMVAGYRQDDRNHPSGNSEERLHQRKGERQLLADDPSEAAQQPGMRCCGSGGPSGCIAGSANASDGLDDGKSHNSAAAAAAAVGDDDDVHITADMMVVGCSGTSRGYQCIKHVAGFALVAKRALDKLECSIAAQPSRQAPPQRDRLSLDSCVNGRVPAIAAAAAAAAVRPLTDFAFMRCMSKRRASTGRGSAGVGQGTPITVVPASCRPSVFVQPVDATADELPAGDGHTPSRHCSRPEVTRSRGDGAYGHTGEVDPVRGVGEGRSAGGGNGDDTSDEVMIVREKAGRPSSGRGAGCAEGRFGVRSGGMDAGSGWDEKMHVDDLLRRPFQPPRSRAAVAVTSTQRPSAGRGRAKSLGMRSSGREASQQQQQQQRITDIRRFAFPGSK